MMELFRRLRYLLNRRRLDQELADDMQFHREMAAREGRGNFGNPLALREEAREAWGWTWIDRSSQDLRYAARMLRKSPGFTITAVLMLALGIGVNIAAFGFFNLMVLRPLPIRDPASLVHFLRSAPGNFADNFQYPEVAFYAEHSTKLSAVIALNITTLALEGEQKQLNANFVTANFFSELGAGAALGRLLDPARDVAANAEPVVALSYRYWQSHFGGDPAIVGRTMRLNSRPATVIGVASREFSGLGIGSPDVWVPITQRSLFVKGSDLADFSDDGTSVFMWGRLGPGATPKAAEDELRSLAAELHRQHPKEIWEKESLPSEPGGYALTVRQEQYPLLAMMAALCLLILAVACGNLGSLLLAQGASRDREIAIRASVGAGRSRLIRQLLTESLALALLGAAAGLAVGYLVLRSLMQWSEAPVWLNPAPDWRVLVFAVAMGFTSAILFGLMPAWQTAWQRRRASFMRRLLIGAQVAASSVLLIVAGLLGRALERAVSAPPGFEYKQVVSIDPHMSGYSPAEAATYLETLQSRLRDLPGVASVSMASNPPLGNRWTVAKMDVAGRMLDVHFNHVDSAFFQTMQIPLLRGRNLRAGETRAIVVSESLARQQWPSEDPLGKLFRTAPGAGNAFTVAGVAGSARLVSPEDSDAVEIYQLPDPALLPAMVILARTSVPPDGLMATIAAAAKSIDPKLFPEVQMLRTAFQGKVKNAEYTALAVTVLGCVALLLACVGVVGLVAYAVSQRTKEIGIRMALGAQPAHVIAVVLRQFTLPVAIGLLAGIGGAAALSQILRRLLYGVSNLDPVAYVAAIGVFATTVAVAALWPASRALRVEPVRALRQD